MLTPHRSTMSEYGGSTPEAKESHQHEPRPHKRYYIREDNVAFVVEFQGFLSLAER
jgi:small nuclear ribonucleoprotein (snRNP)-like protein